VHLERAELDGNGIDIGGKHAVAPFR